MTNSRDSSASVWGDSPLPVAASVSTISGTITFIQPSRIRLKVPSKSNSTCRGGWRASNSRMISMPAPGRKRPGEPSATTGR